MPTEIERAFTDHVEALRALGSVLTAATAVQYIAPPRMAPQQSLNGIPNPTLDIVLDKRRSDVSDAVTRATSSLRRQTAGAIATTTVLTAALSRWEGSHPRDTPSP